MIDEWLEQFEMLRCAGAVIVLKWDGGRMANPYTVVITRADTDFIFHQDANNLESPIADGVAAYRAAHSATGG